MLCQRRWSASDQLTGGLFENMQTPYSSGRPITWNILYHDICYVHAICKHIQYIPRNMHTVFALLCFVVVIHWLISPYPSGLLHWHCGNLTIAPVPAKQPWWIWINTSCEFIMDDCITTTKQSTTKPCAYFLGYTVDAYVRTCIYEGVCARSRYRGQVQVITSHKYCGM